MRILCKLGTGKAGQSQIAHQRQRDHENSRKAVHARLHKLSENRNEHFSERLQLARVGTEPSDRFELGRFVSIALCLLSLLYAPFFPHILFDL